MMKRKGNIRTLDEESPDLPLWNVLVRVAELAKMVREARRCKNNVLAAQLIEQIAKCLQCY